MTLEIITDFPNIKANPRSLRQRKLVFGRGMNDADYQIQPTVDGKRILCPYYMVWRNMMERAYSSKLHARYPTYIGCAVCDEWFSFMTFKAWMVRHDWQGKCLDKDLLIPGNKVYSPDACIFVSQAINNLLNDSSAARGPHPLGVSVDGGKFKAQIRRWCGRRHHLGFFGTPEEASEAYKQAWQEKIKAIAKQQTEPLRSALLARTQEENM